MIDSGNKIFITVENKKIRATLNNTIAANDFYSRLPVSFTFVNSGVDYCCQYAQGKYTINEMQKGWEKGDIVWCSGFLSIIHFDEKCSSGYNVMVIGRIEKADLKLIKNLPKEVLFEFKTHDL